jgi:hypothetical protein
LWWVRTEAKMTLSSSDKVKPSTERPYFPTMITVENFIKLDLIWYMA